MGGLHGHLLIALLARQLPKTVNRKDLQNQADEFRYDIGTVGLPAINGVWLVALLNAAALDYSTLPIIPACIFSSVAISTTFASLLWMYLAKQRLEKKHPYQPPLNLLALRVFGSPSVDDFIKRTEGWKLFGIRQLLDGPDTVGSKSRDVLNYVTGRIDASIVEDRQELAKALSEFQTQPDRRLCFPVNSMQCGNAIWQEALQTLLDDADVVVMDLSHLSESNRGVAYELTLLMEQLPLTRIILLIDTSTDMVVLNEIIASAWANMSKKSPNRRNGKSLAASIRLYSLGESQTAQAHERMEEYLARQRRRLQDKALVSMLYGAAQSGHNPSTVNGKRAKLLMHWTRPGWLQSIIAACCTMLGGSYLAMTLQQLATTH